MADFMNAAVVRHCLEEIKCSFKRQGLSYAEVASRLDVSEVTVKRMLNQDDIGLSRLLQLAELAGRDAGEMLKAASEAPPRGNCFSRRQDEAFFRYPHLFQFYIKLVQRNLSVEEVARLYDLDEVSTWLYLRALEELELIGLAPGNKVSMPGPMPYFSQDSLLMKRGVSWMFEQTSRALAETPRENLGYSVLFLYEEHISLLLEEISKVIMKFQQHQIEEAMEMDGKPVWQFVLLAHPVKSRLPEFEVPRLKSGDLDLSAM